MIAVVRYRRLFTKTLIAYAGHDGRRVGGLDDAAKFNTAADATLAAAEWSRRQGDFVAAEVHVLDEHATHYEPRRVTGP